MGIGVVSFVFLLASVVYNGYLTAQIKKKFRDDHPTVIDEIGKQSAIYAIVDILMLGSLDMMVLYPSDFDPAKQTKYQNYPSADAVDKSIKSQPAEVRLCSCVPLIHLIIASLTRSHLVMAANTFF